MHETAEDLAALQELLDRSYVAAGPHLLRIITPERRLTAEQVCERLTGMRLLALATATTCSLWPSSTLHSLLACSHVRAGPARCGQ